MNQDINTIIADFVNAAVERKLNEWTDSRVKYQQCIIENQQRALTEIRMEVNAFKTEANARMDALSLAERLDKIEEQLRTEQQEQGSTPMGKILQLTLRVAALEEQVDKLRANNIYTPDHVMARLSYVEGAINNMHNTASINQMIEDQILESQEKVEDMLEEKIEELDIGHMVSELLEESINDGTISITFTR
jgi:hypothetical protein